MMGRLLLLLSPVLLLLLLFTCTRFVVKPRGQTGSNNSSALAPLWLRQRQRLGWQGSAANGWAGTAGLSLWHIHPDFLPLHLSNANGLQVLRTGGRKHHQARYLG